MARQLLTGLAAGAVIVGFLNFLWFFAESSTIGGANRGIVSDGHYYFVNAGRTTEVSRQAYEWSAFHGASLFVTHPLLMAGGAYLIFTIAFPSMVGASKRPEDRLRVDRIRASGEVLARARTGGRLGEVWLSNLLIGVEVWPGGVVLSPIGLQPIGIEAGAIVGVVAERGTFGRSGVAIAHRQDGAPRVRLVLGQDHPVVAALRSIATRPPDLNGDGVLSQPAARSTMPYSFGMKAMLVVGFGLSIAFAFVAIPFGLGLGSFGLFWTAGVIAIIGFNAWTYFIRNRDRW